MPKTKHIHQYERVNPSEKWTIYKCQLAGCNHYILPALIVGRFCLCWGCTDPFLLTKENIALKKPMCDNCREDRKLAAERLRVLGEED